MDKPPLRDLQIGCHGTHPTVNNAIRRPLWGVLNELREGGVRIGRRFGTVRHLFGPEQVDCGADEAVVICLLRDAEMWIEPFLEHYRALGARHVFLLDNGSEDGTLERARRHDGVTAFTTSLPFKYFEVGFRRWLTGTFGYRRWALMPDADELWDYPHSDRLSFRDFLRYLNHRRYQAVAAHALDMFSDVPFDRLESSPEDDLRSKYRFYDLSDITSTREAYWIRNGQAQSPEVVSTFGGVRQRFFGTECLCQTRHALHFADRGSRPYRYDGHFAAGSRVADVTTVLLHYKFISTLYDQARRNLELAQHPGGSENYRGFVDVLAAQPGFSLHTSDAAELGSVNELVERGFLTVSPEYLRWVEDHA